MKAERAPGRDGGLRRATERHGLGGPGHASGGPGRDRVASWVLALALAAATLGGGCSPAPQEGRLVLHDVTLIDGRGGPPRPGTTVVIRGDSIEALPPSTDFEPAPGDSVVDATGLWAIPGLWDAHVHLTKAGREALPVLVGMGITSVRDMGGDLEVVREMQRAVEDGSVVGPRIYTPGPMLEAPATIERIRASASSEPYRRTRIPIPDPGRARTVVDSLAALGVDFIKIREYADEATYRAVVEAARGRGLRVAGHAPFSMPATEGARLGLTSFEHASYPYPLDTVPEVRRRILGAFVAGGVTIVPTLVAWETNVMDPDSLAALVADSAAERDPRNVLLPVGLREAWASDVADLGRRAPGYYDGYWGFIRRMSEDLGTMHGAGVPLAAGSDLAGVGLFPGYALHEELRRLVEWVGMSPGEAIAGATTVSAALVSASDSVGTIEPGRAADLVLLSDDPVADIRNTLRVHAVISRGRFLGSGRLRELRRGVPTTADGDIGLVRPPGFVPDTAR